jgi:hypothetical protein
VSAGCGVTADASKLVDRRHVLTNAANGSLMTNIFSTHQNAIMKTAERLF